MTNLLNVEDLPAGVMAELTRVAHTRNQEVRAVVLDVLAAGLAAPRTAADPGPDQLTPDGTAFPSIPRPTGWRVLRVRYGGERLPTRVVIDETTPE